MHLNTIRRIKQERLDVSESHQYLIHAGDVKPIDKNVNTIQKSIRTLLHASKETDLAVKNQAALSMVYSKTILKYGKKR